MLATVLAIALGAALGALARWGLAVALNAAFPSIPPGTLLANLIGAYLIGLAVPWLLAHPELPPPWRLFIVTGFLGGLTTFSTFSLEIATLWQQGRPWMMGGAMALHGLGSLALTLAGMASAQALMKR